MNFTNKKPVRHTTAGTIKASGCNITRGLDKWVVTCAGQFLGERDSFIEAETLADGHLANVRDRVDRMQEERAITRAEHQAEETSEAQRLGIRCTGFDENDEATYD